MTIMQIIASRGKNAGVTKYATWQNGTQVFGDSITFGQGATSWAVQVANAKGISINNFAVSGSQSRFQCRKFMQNAPIIATGGVATFFGFNDSRVSTGQQVRYNNVTAAHKALCAVQWAKSIIFPFQGTTGTQGMTFTNSAGTGAASETPLIDWGSRTYFHRHNDAGNSAANWFNRTVALNETISFSLTGSCIAIGTWGCDGTTTQMSRIQVKVDGTIVTTYDPNGVAYLNKTDPSGTTFTQDGIVNDAIIITGLSNTSHNVVLTFLDNKIGAIDYAAVLKTAAEAVNYPIWINDLPHCSNAAGIGYNYAGYVTTQAIIDGCSSYRKTTLQSAFPGYPLVFVDENAAGYYDPTDSTQVQSDGIHPTTAGDTNISNRVLYYMN